MPLPLRPAPGGVPAPGDRGRDPARRGRTGPARVGVAPAAPGVSLGREAPSGPRETMGYAIAAYAIVLGTLVAYGWRLRVQRRALTRLLEDAPADPEW